MYDPMRHNFLGQDISDDIINTMHMLGNANCKICLMNAEDHRSAIERENAR
jgi:hypothetical protein